jgi:hypothetical protein
LVHFNRRPAAYRIQAHCRSSNVHSFKVRSECRAAAAMDDLEEPPAVNNDLGVDKEDLIIAGTGGNVVDARSGRQIRELEPELGARCFGGTTVGDLPVVTTRN